MSDGSCFENNMKTGTVYAYCYVACCQLLTVSKVIRSGYRVCWLNEKASTNSKCVNQFWDSEVHHWNVFEIKYSVSLEYRNLKLWKTVWLMSSLSIFNKMKQIIVGIISLHSNYMFAMRQLWISLKTLQTKKLRHNRSKPKN